MTLSLREASNTWDYPTPKYYPAFFLFCFVARINTNSFFQYYITRTSTPYIFNKSSTSLLLCRNNKKIKKKLNILEVKKKRTTYCTSSLTGIRLNITVINEFGVFLKLYLKIKKLVFLTGLCICIFQTNERHASFDCTDFYNRQLGVFVDVSSGLYLFITYTSK